MADRPFEHIRLDSPTDEKFVLENFTEDQREMEALDNPKVSALRSQLAPLERWFNRPEVEEIAINRPGEVWLRMRKAVSPGEFWVRHQDPALDYPFLARIAHMVANIQNIPNFGPNGMPAVYGNIPGGHRFVAAIGPNIQYGAPNETAFSGTACMNIRQYTKEQKVDLSDYDVRRGIALRSSLQSLFTKESDPNDGYARVANSLTRGDHILVSGSTGSGKTTLINRLIKSISPHKRYVTIEDTRELIVPAPNRVHIVLSRTDQGNSLDYPAVRQIITRMTPDVVLAGELSTQNAAIVWDLMCSGHGSFMTTVHAESAHEAIGTFIRLIEMANAHAGINSHVDAEALRAQMLAKLRVIQVKKDDRGRFIDEIL